VRKNAVAEQDNSPRQHTKTSCLGGGTKGWGVGFQSKTDFLLFGNYVTDILVSTFLFELVLHPEQYRTTPNSSKVAILLQNLQLTASMAFPQTRDILCYRRRERI
jgi:hypothetical protein